MANAQQKTKETTAKTAAPAAGKAPAPVTDNAASPTQQPPAGQQFTESSPKATKSAHDAAATPAPAPAPAIMPVKRALQASPARFNQDADFVRKTCHYVAEVGTQINDLLDPAYWLHVAQYVKPHDQIEVVAEDGSWYARFFVVASSRLWAKVQTIESVDLRAAAGDTPATDDQAHEVKWMGPIAKHAVIRKSDGAMLKKDFNTMLEGYQWLDQHLRTLAA